MKVKTSNPLPWVLVIVAVFWSWQLNVLAHETCNNEQRYENQVMCEGKEFGCLVPYPDNCSMFLVCDCLYPTVKYCPAHLWWDNKTQLCNYPQAVDCVFYSIETPEPTDGTTKITPGLTERTTKSTSTTEETLTTSSTSWPTSNWDPPPPPPGISEDYCRDQKDGSLHRYPYDCQAYINCTNNWPVLNYCDSDKVFNDLLKICDTPEVADCEELPLPSSTTELTSTSTTEMTTVLTTTMTPTSTTEEDVVCGPTPEDIPEDYCDYLGNGFYEYPYNCSGYLACRNGCTDLDYCQPDKLFNNWLHICDTPDSVQCNPLPYPTTPGSTEKPTTLPTPSTISTTTSEVNDSTESSTVTATEEIPTTTPGLPADVNPNECKGLPDGTIIAYAGNCSQYLICKDNHVQMGDCPPKLLFNPDWLVCDEPGDFTCLGDRTTTPIPTTKPTTTTEQTTPTPTTTTTKATTLGPNELCEGQPLGTSFAYPEDCRKYYLCMGSGDTWLVASCIYGSYFDPSTGECGPNVSPDACKGIVATTPTSTVTPTTTERVTTPRPTTPEPSTTQKIPTTTEAPSTGVCAGRNENENIAYPKNCNKYIVCVSPIPIAFYCPDETFFSSELGKCISSWEESDCEGDQSTTTSEPEVTRPPPEPTMCTNSTRDTFPYPENCQWFIRCVDDYIYMMDVCNCGEYYDPITEKCGADVPSDACRWDYTSTTSTTEEPTTSSPVTRPPPQKGPCDGVDDGVLVPYPNDCSKYIQCTRPIAEAFDCDEGDEFSEALKECVDASLANCSVTTTPTPSEASSTPNGEDSSTSGGSTTTFPTTPTTESSTISSTEFTTESTAKPSTVTPTESTSLSTSKPSTVSSTENPIETSTLPTTESSTASSTKTPTESTTISTTYEPESSSTEPETTTTAKPGDGVCGGKTDDSLVPYPRNCSKYIMCQYPIPVGYDCPIGLEFSPTDLICMDPELAGCSPKLTTTQEPTTAQSTTPSPTVSTTPKTTSESTTLSTTTEPTTPKTSSESTTISTTPKTTSESTTVSTTTEPTTPKTTTELTTVSTTTEPITTEPTTPKPTSESTTLSTTPKTTSESTTVSTTTEPTTPKTTTVSTTTEPTTPKTTSESTTVSTTNKPTTPKTTTESTTVSTTTEPTTPKTTTESTTVSTTTKPTTPKTTSESTTVSTTTEPTTPKTTSESTTLSTTVSTTEVPPITLDPYTPNICCGQPLGTLLAYPNDCSRYVVCDYPIPYAVDCDEGTVFDDKLLQCTATPNERCLFMLL